MTAPFVHLHLHSDYSILDGACKIHEVLDKCKQFGMEACALTDHGNLFGAVEFFQAAQAAKIKPIIGCELYVAPPQATDRQAKLFGKRYNHLLLLCENLTGYHNLCKLSSEGYLSGWRGNRPCVEDEYLARYSEGLIATTSCLAGRVPQALLNDKIDLANDFLKQYVEIFGKDNFLVELMDHGLPEQQRVNDTLAQMAEDHELSLIATNDCHYLNEDDAEAHDALLCIQTGSTIEKQDRMRFQSDQFYVKGPDEMLELFSKWPEAVSNTVKIAERCNVKIPLGESLIPEYKDTEGMTKIDFLTKLVMEGLEFRYGTPSPPEYVARAQYELQIIEEMKFIDYFLVVWDLINFARKEEIPVGPGRGSGAGSIVAYALTITNIDPMRYKLLFERFLNPERVSMPDFDIDFCYNKREKMIKYSLEKYGKENVAQIITFGRMLAKNVIRNVGRVLGMPYGEVDRIAKLVPDELKIKLKDALEKEPQLREMIAQDPQVAKLWRLAERLEGTIGNCGTHAAGVVICDHPLTDHVGLYKASNSETVATQVEMKCVDEVGLLKMDFLGLRTLTVVHKAVQLIRDSGKADIPIDDLEPNDANTYALLRSGHTTGIFQLESSGMRDLAKRIGLESLEEMSALVALYRPGPMQFIDTYIENKFNPERIQYDHDLLKPILEETYGIAVYQEQVMQMVQELGGFSLGQADIVRRAMGKKKLDLLEEQKIKFFAGCAERGINKPLAERIWEKIFAFAGYGFNKSHSVAYAFVAYQTAFLKANYPVEFMCALLTSESGNLDKVAIYVDECRRLGIDVLPPDINFSETDFSVENSTIRFGLSAIKNVGGKATDEIVVERRANGPFNDIYDFCARLDTKLVNKRLMESLNKAGCFASTDWNRRQIAETLDDALAQAASAQRDRAAGQVTLFDLDGMEDTREEMHQKPSVSDHPDHEILQMEKEMLGLYISSHPLQPHEDTLRRFSTVHLDELPECQDGLELYVGGLITHVKIHITQKNTKMAFLTLETLEGPLEITVFTDLYERKAGLLEKDMIVMLVARMGFRNDAPSLVANDIFSIDEAERYMTKAVHVRLHPHQMKEEMLERLAELFGSRRGECDVYLHCTNADMEEIIVHATSACRTAPDRNMRIAVDELLGPGNFWFSAGMGLPSHTPPKIEQPKQPSWKKRAQAAV